MSTADLFPVALPGNKAFSSSFALDSQENLYIVSDSKPDFFAGGTDLVLLPRGGSESRSMLEGNTLFGTPIKTSILGIHISQLASEEVRSAFGLSPPKRTPNAAAAPILPPSPAPAALYATGPMECMWIHDETKIMLLHLQLRKVITVAGLEGSHPPRDGYAVIAPVSPTGEVRPLATFHTPANAAQVNRRMVIRQLLSFGHDDGKVSFRLLDLDTWKVTTIQTERPSLIYGSKLFAWPENPLSCSSVSRDDVVLMVDPFNSFTVSYLSLNTGKIIPGGCDPSLKDKHYARIPIVSSATQPLYLYYEPDKVSLQRTFLGKYEHLHTLPRRAFGAYIASTRWFITADEKQYRVYKGRGPPQSARLPFFDLSELVNNASIDSQDRIQLERLKTVVRVSSLPPTSVEAFILFLHHKYPPKVDWVQLCIVWSHITYLWREIGLTSKDAISTFGSMVVPLLPAEAACTALVDMWNDTQTNWTREDPVIQHLTAHVVKHCFQDFAKFVTLQLTDKNITLAMNVTEFEKSPVAMPTYSGVKQGLKSISLEWKSLSFPPAPKSLLTRPVDFVFSLGEPNDQSIAVVADSRYMFLRWGYFKRLMAFGNGIEKTTRHAVMPNFMSPNMLISILECVHGQLSTLVDEEDAVTLLEHRFEFDLVSAQDVPFPPFQQLIQHCMGASFPKISETNCFAHLERAHRAQMPTRVEEALKFIVASNPLLRANALLSLPLDLIGQLQLKYQESTGLK